MTRRTDLWYRTIAGFLLLLFGIVLIVWTFPVFSHTRQEVKLVPMTENIINGTFSLDQSHDKIVTFQLSVGENITILAVSSGNMSCSIVNFTKTGDAIQPDRPDVVYFFQNGTTSINKTWSPPTRLSGKYYLIFLAREVPVDMPVQVNANATKTWTAIQLIDVPVEDRIPLLDQTFVYVGSVMVIIGILVVSIAYSRSRIPRSHASKTRRIER